MLSIEYIAGLFDGEGSIGLYSNGGTGFGVRVQTVQNLSALTQPVWEELKDTYGGGISVVPSTSGRMKMNWAVSGESAVLFLEKLLPYLILKRPQAELICEWYRSRPPRQRDSQGRILARSGEEKTESLRVARLLREMKTATLNT